jgi:hypothetical protein
MSNKGDTFILLSADKYLNFSFICLVAARMGEFFFLH